MPIRILSHDDVHRCLPPKACVDAMEQALSALARGESSFPLRSVFRPQGSSGFLGLMPGYRGGEQPLYALKAVCIFPENPARHGIDAHQGGVLLSDGETGELTAVVDGAALTAIRTAAVTASLPDLGRRHRVRVVADGEVIHEGLMLLMVASTTPFYGRGLLVNEINTIPGFTPISLFPTLPAEGGLDFTAVCRRVLDLAGFRAGAVVIES